MTATVVETQQKWWQERERAIGSLSREILKPIPTQLAESIVRQRYGLPFGGPPGDVVGLKVIAADNNLTPARVSVILAKAKKAVTYHLAFDLYHPPKEFEGSDASIATLGFDVRIVNHLWRRGVQTVGDLCGKSREELWSIPQLGNASMKPVINALAQRGLKLRDE